MKTFITACIVAIVIAIGGAVVLGFVQEPVSEAYMSSTGVRI
jgi:hypothetical protein